MNTPQLLTGYELEKLARNLPDGESLVISGGKVYRVKTSGIKDLADSPVVAKVAGKSGNNFNPFTFMQSQSWVESPARAFKNWWDSGALKSPKNTESLDVFFWNLLVELSPIESIECGHEILNRVDGQYFSVKIKDTNFTAFYGKSLTLRFFRDDSTGQETWV